MKVYSYSVIIKKITSVNIGLQHAYLVCRKDE